MRVATDADSEHKPLCLVLCPWYFVLKVSASMTAHQSTKYKEQGSRRDLDHHLSQGKIFLIGNLNISRAAFDRDDLDV